MAGDGLCECGCGQLAPIASRTYGKRGIRKGDPQRFIPTHQLHAPKERSEPNPSGLCKCGCGQPTPLAPYSRISRGWVEGKPVNYVAGHHRRKHHLRYVVDESTGCWNWQGGINSNGYGVYHLNGKLVTAHRLVYERERGSIPDGLELDHECKNRRCVNPDHLTPRTKQDHSLTEARRGSFRRWPLEAQEEALKLRGQMSARAAARILGADRGSVTRLWKRGAPK